MAITSIDPNKSMLQVRIQELAQKILDNYADSDLRKYSQVEAYTIKRWAKGSHSPQPRSIPEISKIIAVSDQSLSAYLNGTIDIFQLWEKRGEALRFSAKEATDYDAILYAIKNMPSESQLAILGEIIECLQLGAHKSEAKAVPDCPATIDLTDKQKARLQSLFAESKRYGSMTDKDLMEGGVYAPLVQDLAGEFSRQYDREAYQSLAPHLFEVLQWVEDLPILAYPSKIETVEQLLHEIE